MQVKELAVVGALTLLLIVSIAITVPVELSSRKHSHVDKVQVASGSKPVRYYVIGDYGELDKQQTMDVELVAQRMANLSQQFPVDFIATVGDNVYPSGMIDVFDRTQFELMYNVFNLPGIAGKPWYPVLGNHDCEHTPPMLEANKFYPMWNMPSDYYNLTLMLSNDTYAAFVFLNGCTIACEEVNGHRAGYCQPNVTESEIDAQYSWLQSVLQDTTDAAWVLVHIHMPPFSAGSDHGDSEALKLRLYPLLTQYHVDFLFGGHDHVMQYLFIPQGATYDPLPDDNFNCADYPAYQRFAGENFVLMQKGEGLHEVDMGASGHSLDLLCVNKTTSMDELVFGSTTYGFLQVEVASDSVTAQFYDTVQSDALFTVQVCAGGRPLVAEYAGREESCALLQGAQEGERRLCAKSGEGAHTIAERSAPRTGRDSDDGSEHISLRSIQQEIVEPLELFQANYIEQLTGLAEQGNSVVSHLQKARTAMARAKEAYFESCLAHERLEVALQTDSSERNQRNLQQARAQSKQMSDRYILSIEKANQLWDEHDRQMPDVLLAMQQNYESRIHFLKYSLEKLVKAMNRLHQQELKTYADLNTAVCNINSNLDIRLLVDSFRGKVAGVTRERFVPFEEQKRQLAAAEARLDDDFLILEGVEPDADRLLATKVLSCLFTLVDPDPATTHPIIAELSDAIKSREGRLAFMEVLSNWSDSTLSPSGLTQLAALFNTLLSALQTQNDRDAQTLYRVLIMADTLTSDFSGTRKSLREFIAAHPVWSDFSRWQQVIDWAVASRISKDRDSLEKIKKRREGSTVKGLFRAFKSIAKGLPAFPKDVSDDQVEKSSVFMVLSQFGTLLRNFEVPGDFACEVMLACSHRARLDSERVCMLLAELQASQIHSSGHEAPVSLIKHSVLRREKDRVYWKDFLPLGECLPFLDLPEIHVLLQTSKRLSFLLLKPAAKLLLLERKDIRVSRERVWLALLKPYSLTADYSAEQQAVAFSPLPKETEDVIANDVVRSFQFAPELPKEPLTNLLRAYAHFNPAVGYCQGMNYLFGTLFLIFKDEDKAYRCGVGLVNRYQMSSIFYSQLPRLKVMLYQLDRLVARFLPQVQDLFRRETISAAHFASSWFMTLFSSSLQSSPEKFAILMRLWDAFLLVRNMQKGWKVMFAAALTVLATLQTELLTLPYDHVMAMLTSVSSPACQLSLFTDSFLASMQQWKVTNSLLKSLEAEYEHLKLRSNRSESK